MRPFKKGFVTKCASYGIDKETAKALFEKLAEGGIIMPENFTATPNPGAKIQLTDHVPPIAPPRPMPVPAAVAEQLNAMSIGESNRMRDIVYRSTPHGTSVPAPGTLAAESLPQVAEKFVPGPAANPLPKGNITGSGLKNWLTLKGEAVLPALKGAGKAMGKHKGKAGIAAAVLGALGLGSYMNSGDEAAPETAAIPDAAPMPPETPGAPETSVSPAATSALGLGEYAGGAALGGLGGAGLGYGLGSALGSGKKDDNTARNMAIAGGVGGAGLVPLLQYLASKQSA